MKPVYNLAEFVPHSGKMSLLDEIVDFGSDWLSATVRITPNSMFVEEDGVSAVIGIEYLAQTVAAFAGSRERQTGHKPKLGFLLGVRKFTTSVEFFPIDSVLSLVVNLEMEADNGLSVFTGTLKGKGFEASAKLNVFQPADLDRFLEGAV